MGATELYGHIHGAAEGTDNSMDVVADKGQQCWWHRNQHSLTVLCGDERGQLLRAGALGDIEENSVTVGFNY